MKNPPLPKTSLENNILEDKSTPKIFFGITEDSYYADNPPMDSKFFLDLQKFNVRLHSSKNLRKTLENIKDLNKKNSKIRFSESFIDSILEAKDRIWLIDGYLHWADEKDKNNTKLKALIEIIELRMEYVTQVRFYFKQDKYQDSIEEILNKFNHELKHKYNKIIDYRFFSYENIHDRFAIIDDVLWHFGSDVGATNPSLNATSYGWDANYLKAIEFFDEFWSAEYEK